MTLGSFALAVLTGGIAINIVDWALLGTAFTHRYYAYAPEAWRVVDKAGERPRIAVSALLAFVTVTVVAVLAEFAGIHGAARLVAFAVLLWIAAPLTLVVSNHMFMRVHVMVTTLLTAAWLLRLLISALAVAAFS